VEDMYKKSFNKSISFGTAALESMTNRSGERNGHPHESFDISSKMTFLPAKNLNFFVKRNKKVFSSTNGHSTNTSKDKLA